MSFGWTGLLSDNLIGNNKGYLEYPKQVSNTCFFSLVCSVVYCNAILFDQFYSESFLFINLFGSSLIHNTDSCYQTTSRLYLVAYVSFVEHRCWNSLLRCRWDEQPEKKNTKHVLWDGFCYSTCVATWDFVLLAQ